MSNLNRWQQLSIVGSVLWAFLVLGIAGSEYFQAVQSEQEAQKCLEEFEKSKNEKILPGGLRFVPCVDAKAKPHFLVVLGALVIPIPLIWASAYTIVGAISGKLWAHRLLVVLSALWFLACVIFIEPFERTFLDTYENVYKFLAIGVVPLVVIWGVIWVLNGVFIAKSKSN